MSGYSLPSVCMRNLPLNDIKVKIQKPHHPGCLEDMTQIYRVIDMPYTHQVRVHRSCICNEVSALHNRHLCHTRTSKYSEEYFLKVVEPVMAKLDLDMGVVDKISLWDVVKSYKGAKRKIYAKAYDDFVNNGFDERSARIKMFIKPDRYDAEKIMEKAPRAIQYRKPMYNLLLAQFLKPVEHKLYATIDEFEERWCAKGLNIEQRADVLVRSSTYFEYPAFLLLDHSKFDSSITQLHLKYMAERYNKWCPSKLLQWLLRFQQVNIAVSKHGLRYRVKGTKMSGDYNTALDNSLLNYLTLQSWLDKNKIMGKLFVDGDDSVVIIESKHLEKLMADFEHFEKIGFTTKCDVVYDIAEVEFCRAKILWDGKQARMARDPLRALSNMTVTLKKCQGKALAKYVAGNALCEMYRSSGCPIVYPAAKAIYSRFSRWGYSMDVETRYKFELYNSVELVEPTDTIREEFAKAYAIPIEDQKRIEAEIPQQIRTITEIDSPYESAKDVPLY